MRRIFCKDPFTWLGRTTVEETPVKIISPSGWSALIFLFVLFILAICWAFLGSIPLFVEGKGVGAGSEIATVLVNHDHIQVGAQAELVLPQQKRLLARVIRNDQKIEVQANEPIDGPFTAKIVIGTKRPIAYVK